MRVLDVDIVQKRFPSPVPGQPDTVALEGLKFEVPSGQFACVLGPSGSGKTTLLQLVSGLDREYDGRITVAGQRPAEGPPLGYMFQSDRLMPWLTVLENVSLVATDAAQAKGMPKTLLELMELGSSLQTYPNRLSGGMRRRAALARAFVNEPPLFLLDEPFISLDAPVAQRLRQLLLELWQAQGATIIFVTHDLREAIQLGDRILFMSSSPGRVALDHTIDLGRPRKAEGEEIEEYRSYLLDKHPALLEGVRAMDEAAAKGTDVVAPTASD